MTDVTDWRGGKANSVTVRVLGTQLVLVEESEQGQIGNSWGAKPVVTVVVHVASVTLTMVMEVLVTVLVRVPNSVVVEKVVFV